MSPEDRKEEAAPAGPPAPPPGSVADLFTKALPGIEIQAIQGVRDVLLVVDRKDARRVLERAKNDKSMDFDFLRSLSGVDFEADGFEVVYHLYSYSHRHAVTVRAKVPREETIIPSVADLWEAADWHERECRDMFGIVFEGHPNLVPLLLPEDMLDHFPLRKDNPLQPLEEWQGELLGDNVGEAGHIPPGSGFEPPPKPKPAPKPAAEKPAAEKPAAEAKPAADKPAPAKADAEKTEPAPAVKAEVAAAADQSEAVAEKTAGAEAEAQASESATQAESADPAPSQEGDK